MTEYFYTATYQGNFRPGTQGFLSGVHASEKETAREAFAELENKIDKELKDMKGYFYSPEIQKFERI